MVGGSIGLLLLRKESGAAACGNHVDEAVPPSLLLCSNQSICGLNTSYRTYRSYLDSEFPWASTTAGVLGRRSELEERSA